jgi:hypothetical protein
MNVKEITERLREPFPQEDIEWRVQRVVQVNNRWQAVVVPFVQNRAIQNRLDEVFGVAGWENVYQPIHQGILCGIRAWINGREITKWDGADITNIEPTKGGLSNAMKRAAVQWGIGRYLYDLEEVWVEINNTKKTPQDIYLHDKNKNVKGYWTPPTLPSHALPKNQDRSNQSKENPPIADRQDPQLENLWNLIGKYESAIGLNKQPGYMVRIFNKANNTQFQSPIEMKQKATLEMARSYYNVLKPVYNIVVAAEQNGMKEQLLDFAQIVKPDLSVESIFNLFFNLSNQEVKEIIQMIKAEKRAHQRSA